MKRNRHRRIRYMVSATIENTFVNPLLQILLVNIFQYARIHTDGDRVRWERSVVTRSQQFLETEKKVNMIWMSCDMEIDIDFFATWTQNPPKNKTDSQMHGTVSGKHRLQMRAHTHTHTNLTKRLRPYWNDIRSQVSWTFLWYKHHVNFPNISIWKWAII